MSATHSRYMLGEMVTGALISGMLSLASAWLLFGRQPYIAVGGIGGVLADTVVQTLIVSTMSTLVPTLLARRRIALGALMAPEHYHPRLPYGLLKLVLGPTAIALGVAAAGFQWHQAIDLATLLICKVCYGAALGAWITRLALLRILRPAVRPYSVPR